ncbi:MAG: sigma-54 dependent transcriptional regulator [Gemmatimonadota bacterium]|nr:sigma-54 dependent transcriptional regulator [Gemmatimonadota bacterium]
MTPARLLIVDDEPQMLENLDRILSDRGHECFILQDPTEFRTVLQETRPDVVITDLSMPEVDGMTLLSVAKADDPLLPVILITAYATVPLAVDAMQEGAFDFIAKPFAADQLAVAVDRAVRYRRLLLENDALRSERGSAASRIVGSSPALTHLVDQVTRVAGTDANVLLTGESGTGKELVARLVHEESPRREGPFVAVDCAALPESILESELFGHTKGAFTGASSTTKGLMVEANSGTLFLDEVGELAPPLQAKLLRALEAREVRALGSTRPVSLDVRVVAATNVDLASAVLDGDFREDLFYRLNVVHFELPPLRRRRSDVPLLADRFLKDFAATSTRQSPIVTPEAWKVLEAYDWPGNVRQLRNVIERAVALDTDGRITVSDLPPELRERRQPSPQDNHAGPYPDWVELPYAEAWNEATRRFRSAYLTYLMEQHDGNVSKAARAAGVSRRTLHRWLAEERGEAPEGGAQAGDGQPT